MQIVEIDYKITGVGITGLILNPPMDRAIFEQVERLSAKSKLFAPMCFRHERGRFIFHCPALTEHIRENIQLLLNEAEKQAPLAKAHTQKQIALENSDKDSAVKLAAEIFRVPIK